MSLFGCYSSHHLAAAACGRLAGGNRSGIYSVYGDSIAVREFPVVHFPVSSHLHTERKNETVRDVKVS